MKIILDDTRIQETNVTDHKIKPIFYTPVSIFDFNKF